MLLLPLALERQQNGSMNNLSSMAMARLFGRRELNKITSLAISTSVVGSALGPLPLGAANDFFGGYARALLLAALWPCMNAILLLVNMAMMMEDEEKKKSSSPVKLPSPRTMTMKPAPSTKSHSHNFGKTNINDDDDADIEDRLLLRDDL